jgi:hypothetical protein
MLGPLRLRWLTVVAFAVAMAYLESAVVVYLQRALEIVPGQLFPLRTADMVGDLAAIEVGREAATIVMLAAVGCLAGRRWQDRLAWTAIGFGVWDLLYYFWLWVFIGWPAAPATWDVLFLIPVPWTGPVWAPALVSLALIGFGTAAARRIDAGRRLEVGRVDAGLGVLGGSLVVLSFTLDASSIMAGAMPGWFAWPVFAAGMTAAAIGASHVLLGPAATANQLEAATAEPTPRG